MLIIMTTRRKQVHPVAMAGGFGFDTRPWHELLRTMGWQGGLAVTVSRLMPLVFAASAPGSCVEKTHRAFIATVHRDHYRPNTLRTHGTCRWQERRLRAQGRRGGEGLS